MRKYFKHIIIFQTKTRDYMNTPTFSHLLVIGEENKEICSP